MNGVAQLGLKLFQPNVSPSRAEIHRRYYSICREKRGRLWIRSVRFNAADFIDKSTATSEAKSFAGVLRRDVVVLKKESGTYTFLPTQSMSEESIQYIASTLGAKIVAFYGPRH